MEVVGFGDSRLRREVSFLALVSSTPTRVPHTQPSSHFPPHSEPGELVAQARLTPPCSAFLTAPRHHSRGCAAKAAGNSGCGAGRIPTLPAPRAPSSGPLVPDPRECGALFPSHLLRVHLSVRDGEGRRRRDASQPPPLGGGGGRAESARAEGSLCSPSPQRCGSVLAAAAAAAVAWAAWGGDCASPRLRSAGDLNATETVIHHRRSQQTFAGSSAIGWHSHVPLP